MGVWKVNYIHDNPVMAGFEDEPHHYFYSSAHPASPLVPDPMWLVEAYYGILEHFTDEYLDGDENKQ